MSILIVFLVALALVAATVFPVSPMLWLAGASVGCMTLGMLTPLRPILGTFFWLFALMATVGVLDALGVDMQRAVWGGFIACLIGLVKPFGLSLLVMPFAVTAFVLATSL